MSRINENSAGQKIRYVPPGGFCQEKHTIVVAPRPNFRHSEPPQFRHNSTPGLSTLLGSRTPTYVRGSTPPPAVSNGVGPTVVNGIAGTPTLPTNGLLVSSSSSTTNGNGGTSQHSGAAPWQVPAVVPPGNGNLTMMQNAPPKWPLPQAEPTSSRPVPPLNGVSVTAGGPTTPLSPGVGGGHPHLFINQQQQLHLQQQQQQHDVASPPPPSTASLNANFTRLSSIGSSNNSVGTGSSLSQVPAQLPAAAKPHNAAGPQLPTMLAPPPTVPTPPANPVPAIQTTTLATGSRMPGQLQPLQPHPLVQPPPPPPHATTQQHTDATAISAPSSGLPKAEQSAEESSSDLKWGAQWLKAENWRTHWDEHGMMQPARNSPHALPVAQLANQQPQPQAQQQPFYAQQQPQGAAVMAPLKNPTTFQQQQQPYLVGSATNGTTSAQQPMMMMVAPMPQPQQQQQPMYMVQQHQQPPQPLNAASGMMMPHPSQQVSWLQQPQAVQQLPPQASTQQQQQPQPSLILETPNYQQPQGMGLPFLPSPGGGAVYYTTSAAAPGALHQHTPQILQVPQQQQQASMMLIHQQQQQQSAMLGYPSTPQEQQASSNGTEFNGTELTQKL